MRINTSRSSSPSSNANSPTESPVLSPTRASYRTIADSGLPAARASSPGSSTAPRGAIPGRQPNVAIDYDALGWESQQVDTVPVGVSFNHANASGELGGAGQTGRSGEAIWMTSGDHVNAARGYSRGSGQYFVLQTTAPLKLAVLDEQGNQVFPDELQAWKNAARQHGLDGVKTKYESFDEVVLFDRSKIAHVDTRHV